MSKLKLEHGVSRIRRTKLQFSIDQSIADDIEMLAEWSNNETNYIVNELLRFALNQEEDFQRHKASFAANTTRPAAGSKSAVTGARTASESTAKADTASATHA